MPISKETLKAFLKEFLEAYSNVIFNLYVCSHIDISVNVNISVETKYLRSSRIKTKINNFTKLQTSKKGRSKH